MRRLGIAMVIIAGMVRSAPAETARAHAIRGEALAREGRLSEAIEAFKTADRIEPRASHACLIALAYIRRELWTQAELFLARCRERAHSVDPLPDWVPLAESELRQRSAAARLAKVAIVVEPSGTPAEITLASFAPDEQFAARTLRLPIGHHVITATAPGHEPVRAIVDVTDARPKRVVLRFDDAPPPPSRVPTIVSGVGGALIAGGVAYHLLALRPARDELAEASEDDDVERYDRGAPTFDRRRLITYGLYGAGAAAVLTGIALRYTIFRDAPERAPRVSARVGDGGATVSLEWHR